MPTWICERCGKGFEGYGRNGVPPKYCSKVCRYKGGHLHEFTCQHCGKVFRGYLFKGKPHKYCSKECHYAVGRVAATCMQCGTKFIYHKSESPKGGTKYCSAVCLEASHYVELVCQWCQQTFRVTRPFQHQKFCSQQCAGYAKRGYHKDGTPRCSVAYCKEPVVEEHLCAKHLERRRVLFYPHPQPELALKMRFDKDTPEGGMSVVVNSAAYQRELRARWKLDVLSYYSQGTPQCAFCGFDDIRALCIDHVHNNGNEHRKSLINGKSRGYGSAIYRWLKKNHYPEGFQVLCANCNMIKEAIYTNAIPGRRPGRKREESAHKHGVA